MLCEPFPFEFFQVSKHSFKKSSSNIIMKECMRRDSIYAHWSFIQPQRRIQFFPFAWKWLELKTIMLSTIRWASQRKVSHDWFLSYVASGARRKDTSQGSFLGSGREEDSGRWKGNRGVNMIQILYPWLQQCQN